MKLVLSVMPSDRRRVAGAAASYSAYQIGRAGGGAVPPAATGWPAAGPGVEVTEPYNDGTANSSNTYTWQARRLPGLLMRRPHRHA